jgi:flagellar biosynthetic protein FlhB
MGLILLALAVFASVDVPLQKRLHGERLKMSHQELKQEQKELDGNAEVKGKVRARMREMTKRRMMTAVPKADLVVMNPTHYAVALKYDDKTMGAPRVVAKGADLLALRIRDLAQGASVPVLEAPVLARALYAHAELDREIPAALFAAVAQVLAYVYQLRAALRGRSRCRASCRRSTFRSSSTLISHERVVYVFSLRESPPGPARARRVTFICGPK